MGLYKSINNQAIQIQSIASGGTGEITINLHPTNPTIIVKKSPYISGVYDSNGNITNSSPAIQIDGYNSTILNNVRTISATAGSEVTLKLNTKLIKA